MHTAKHCIRTRGSVPYTPSFDARQCQLDHKLQSGQHRPFVPHHLPYQIRPTPRTNPLSHGTGLKSPQNTMTLLNFRWYPLRTHQSTTIHPHLHLHRLPSLAQNQNPFLLPTTTMNPVSISFLLPPLIFRLCPSPCYHLYPLSMPVMGFSTRLPFVLFYGLPDYPPRFLSGPFHLTITAI